LAGVGRERWLREGRIREARLPRSDLARATGLAWFNSVRGWCQAGLASSAG
jgi:para-aminobenzoate synthetase/4-amino-4-deoxychorismate lyase